MKRKYELTESEAELLFARVDSHCKALRNWIAGAVESGNNDRAKDMVKELRVYEGLFSKLNVAAHRVIDGIS